jgi:hypothetical protein
LAFNIKDVLSSLRTSASPFDEGTGEFLSIDTGVAKENLDLATRAKENGVEGIPTLATSKKDTMAAEIDSYLEQLILVAKDKFIERMHAIDDLSKSQSKGGSIQYITEIFENGKFELKKTARDRYNALFSAKREWVLGEQEYSHFRAENKRIGPARYPQDKVKIFGWIFFITIVEIFTNAYALGDAHPSGPVGVVLEILMFGIANVGVAFLLGCYVWRYFNHVSSGKKAAALILALPMMSFIVFLNFLLAHYRDAIAKLAGSDLGAFEIEASMQKLGAVATSSLTQNPFLLEDFKSYLLLFVGLLASVFATKKSFELDDPYPGYGKITREQEELATAFNFEQTDAFSEMNDLVDDYSNQINTQLSFVKNNEDAIKNRQSDKKLLFDKFNNWLSSTQSVGEALYAFYREENMRVRKSKKEPKCFNIEYKLSLNSGVKMPKAQRFSSSYSSVEKTCEKFLKELNEQSERYQNSFKDIENMSPDKILDSKFKTPTIFKD